MSGLRHPVTSALYVAEPDSGLVRVEADTAVGWFSYRGEWRAGDRFPIDPMMCNWVGGPNAGGGYAKPMKTM
jgi:hypothetical protein